MVSKVGTDTVFQKLIDQLCISFVSCINNRTAISHRNLRSKVFSFLVFSLNTSTRLVSLLVLVQFSLHCFLVKLFYSTLTIPFIQLHYSKTVSVCTIPGTYVLAMDTTLFNTVGKTIKGRTGLIRRKLAKKNQNFKSSCLER
jgi:hypothetical protein